MSRMRWACPFLAALAVAGVGTARAVCAEPARPDVRKVGGTVLVYEIDRHPEAAGPDAELAEALQRRLAESGLKNVTVRLLGNRRVEVQVPGSGGRHARDVQAVKALVRQAGHLEFRVLANQHDDRQAIADARAEINDPAGKEKLEQAAAHGRPPWGPGGDAPRQYQIKLPGNKKSVVTYSWAELGPQERRQLGLDGAAGDDPGDRRKVWAYVRERLGQAVPIPDPAPADDRLLLQGALFYAREARERSLPRGEKRKKRYEVFVLTRNPEIDPTGVKQTPAVTGAHLRTVQAATQGGRPAVSFTFTPEGGRLFGTLTGKNVPTDDGPEGTPVKRHLAIILDGIVMAAPTINTRITAGGQITGRFTREEVDHLVAILRAGALPATLRPEPVSEVTVEATKKGG